MGREEIHCDPSASPLEHGRSPHFGKRACSGRGPGIFRWFACGGRHAAKEETAPEGTSDRYSLAYDAAVHALSQQDSSLGNLRNRATGLVTIATLIGSFTGFFGVGTKDKPLPVCYAVGLILFILLIVSCVVYVLLPRGNWPFGPDPQDILNSTEVGSDRLRWSQALGMAEAIQENERKIRKRAKVYTIGVSLLGLEAVYAVAVSLAAR